MIIIGGCYGYMLLICFCKRAYCFYLRDFRCPTVVVQLPHSCGATAPQLWCNCPTAVGQRLLPLKKQELSLKKQDEGSENHL